jgi:hypothetical protein
MYLEAVEAALNGGDDDDEESECGRQKRHLSSFMLARLAVVLRKEYHADRLETYLETVEEEQKTLVNWICQGVKTAEDERVCAERNGSRRIQLAWLEMEKDRLARMEQCQAILQLQRQIIVQTMQLRMEKIREQEMKEQMVVKRPVVPSTITASGKDGIKINSSRWLEETLDENYFPTAASSSTTSTHISTDTSTTDWVVCRY